MAHFKVVFGPTVMAGDHRLSAADVCVIPMVYFPRFVFLFVLRLITSTISGTNPEPDIFLLGVFNQPKA